MNYSCVYTPALQFVSKEHWYPAGHIEHLSAATLFGGEQQLYRQHRMWAEGEWTWEGIWVKMWSGCGCGCGVGVVWVCWCMGKDFGQLLTPAA